MPTWRARCEPPARWLSTNHLVGAGYWVWLIPLASGSHSVGIVADAKLHPLATMNTFDKAMDWLAAAPAAPVRRARRQARRGCWTSPSSAISPTAASRCSRPSAGRSPARRACSSTRSIRPAATSSPSPTPTSPSWSRRDRAGRPIAAHAQLYDQIFHSFYESTLALYTDQYAIFGDPEVLPVKVIWDYTYYWGVLAQFFFQRRLADLPAFSALRDELAHCQALNDAVQALLRDWSAARPLASVANPATMLDQAALPWFSDLNKSLLDRLDDAAFRERIRHSTRQMRALAAEIAARAGQHGGSAAATLGELLESGARFGAVGAGSAPMLFALGGLKRPQPSGDDAQARAGADRADHRGIVEALVAKHGQHLGRAAGSQLTSRPPEVCGSLSRSRATAGRPASSCTSTP